MEQHDPFGNGTIGYQEFLTITSDRMVARDPEAELVRAFELFDDDCTGRISLRNMRVVVRELGENLSDRELQGMITEFDRDGDGEISLQEFGGACPTPGTALGSTLCWMVRPRSTRAPPTHVWFSHHGHRDHGQVYASARTQHRCSGE
eukprot:955202-Prymnesium_polylepis.1